ncbi:MAG: hypothetical protein LBT52_00745 [Clostridiales Family XIII bacterium]|jgi:hypothetical protein|nr:hypothetical protein [Clostridiales Family XIII bacterium]
MARTIKNRELNLLAALDRGKQRKKAGKGAIIIIALVAVVVASVALFYMYMLDQTDISIEQRDIALAYVNDPDNQRLYNESITNQQAAQEAQARADAIAGTVEGMESYPDMMGKDYKKLFRIAGGKVDMSGISYDHTTGTLSFAAKCQSATRVPIFIAALRSCGIFSDVYYAGYAGGTYTVPGEPIITSDGAIIETQTTMTEYAFNVTCLVNTEEQKIVAEAAAAADEDGE